MRAEVVPIGVLAGRTASDALHACCRLGFQGGAFGAAKDSKKQHLRNRSEALAIFGMAHQTTALQWHY